MNKYGQTPKHLGVYSVDCKEMMFYQYLPIKMAGTYAVNVPKQLDIFRQLLTKIENDFIDNYGMTLLKEVYIYVSAKYLYQPRGISYNRPGFHCDGFMTDDVNYIWSDKFPTIFNVGTFNLTQDDKVSIEEMEQQAISNNNISYLNNSLIMLDQYNVHKVGDVTEADMRTFLKVSFSKDKYDLEGNAHNYLIDYQWDMKPRQPQRNIPQSFLQPYTT